MSDLDDIMGDEQESQTKAPKPKKRKTTKVKEKFNDVTVPKHYNVHPSGIEPRMFIRYMSMCIGSAMKYLWRCDEKRDAIEDLNKAIFWIEEEILVRGGKVERRSEDRYV